MANRTCASCQTQINTCDLCGADWPSHMLDTTNDGNGDAPMVCDTDWGYLRGILGLSVVEIRAAVAAYKTAHGES